MRAIHLASLDKIRPVLVLTREIMRPHLSRVTVAPVTTTIRGLSTEVEVGEQNGLDGAAAINCDNIITIGVERLGRQVGFLFDSQEDSLAEAITLAFDLR